MRSLAFFAHCSLVIESKTLALRWIGLVCLGLGVRMEEGNIFLWKPVESRLAAHAHLRSSLDWCRRGGERSSRHLWVGMHGPAICLWEIRHRMGDDNHAGLGLSGSEATFSYANVPDDLPPLAFGIRACSAGEMPKVPKAWWLGPSVCSLYFGLLVFGH
jgi:hypothetical protein